MRLRTKILLAFIGVASIPIASFGYITFQNNTKHTITNIEEELIQISTIKLSALERWINQNKTHISGLAQRPQLREYTQLMMDAAEGDPVYSHAQDMLIQDHLSPNLDSQSGFDNFSIIRASDGVIAVSTNEKTEGTYRKSHLFFIEGLKDIFVDDVNYEVSSEEAVMHISTPIYGTDGRVIAVLTGHLNLSDMSAMMAEGHDLKYSRETYLINSANFFVTESRFHPNSMLKRTAYSEGIEKCLQGNTFFGEFNDYRGVPVLGYYSWIPNRDLCLVTEIDQSEAFQPVRNLLIFYYLIGILLTMGVAALAIIFSKTLTDPVLVLEKGAKEITSGNLNLQIEPRSKDELGAVAAAFNQMAQSLKESRDDISETNQLLAALQNAAQSIQQADTHVEVFRCAGEEIGKIGFDTSVFILDESQKHLGIAYLSFESGAIEKVEKMMGISRKNYMIPLQRGSIFHQVINQSGPILLNDFAQIAEQAIPKKAHKFVKFLLSLIGIRQGVVCALRASDQVFGIVVISSKQIRQSAVSAISTFANQMANVLQTINMAKNSESWAVELEDRVHERTKTLELTRVASLNMMEDLQKENVIRKATEESLRREKERAQGYLDIAGVMILVLDKKGNIALINQKGCQMLGYEEKDLLGKNWFDTCLPKEAAASVKKVFKDLMTSKTSPFEYYENPILAKSGEERLIAWHNSLLFDGTAIVGNLSSGEDITDRKAAENRVRTLLNISDTVSHQLYDQNPLQAALDELIKNMPSADSASIWLFNEDKRVYKAAAWIGLPDEPMRSSAIPENKGILGYTCKTKKGTIRNNIPSDKKYIQFEGQKSSEIKSIISAPIIFQDSVLGAICVDNTRRINAFSEEDLAMLESIANHLSGITVNTRLFEETQKNREELRSLSKRLVDVHEEERKLVAMDLHDYFGQVLTSLKLSMRPESFIKKSVHQQQELIHEANLLIDEIMDSAEDLSLRLRPTIIDDLGITPAFEWHVNRYRKQTDLHIDLNIELEHAKRYPPELEITLYRVMEEGLTNSVKYSNSKKIKINVFEKDAFIHMTIQDFGVGFDLSQLEKQPGRHTGITGIRERVRLLDGTMDMHSEEGVGTTIHVALPIVSQTSELMEYKK